MDDRLTKKKGIKQYFMQRPHLIFLMPTTIILAILVIIPTVFLYYISMTDYELGYNLLKAEFVGFENYIRLFSGKDAVFWHSVWISLLFMLATTSIELVLGYLTASLLNLKEFKLKGLVFGWLIIPIAMTPSITGQIWKLIMNAEYGLLNHILEIVFGTKITWLGAEMAFLSIIIIDIWQWTPYMALIIYAGLRSIPAEPYESARVDGANILQKFRYITIPLLKPLLILVVLFRGMDSLKLFDIPYVLTQGGPGNATELMSLHIFRLGFAQTGFIGRAAAMSVVLLLTITFLSQFILKYFRNERGRAQ
ncbi:MAG: sugar ABC transporter permease [Firmicutes bacterium]|nr:sugar ABC transporter permease [Bacillota bacterium]